MKTSTHYPMSAAALSRRNADASRGWLPAELATGRAHDVSYWLSRAARGYSWNSAGITRKNP
jgi:hypothetical protein